MHRLKDKIQTLLLVNYQLTELSDIKQKLEKEIISDFNHNVDGSRIYGFDVYKITIKTDYIYSLDKSKYSLIKDKLPRDINPVKESASFKIDKRVIKYAETTALPEYLLLLGECISKKPCKPNVKVIRDDL